jgi:hypothetical protein
LGVLTEQQTSSKFCFENAVENFEMLKRAFGDMLGRPQVFEWFFKFKNCGTSLKMLTMPGCPVR